MTPYKYGVWKYHKTGPNILFKLYWCTLGMPYCAYLLRNFSVYITPAGAAKYLHTGCFKKSLTILKACINLFRGHVQCFELS
jgi:hypothetical protein